MLIEALKNMVVDDMMNQFLNEIYDKEEVKLQKYILISKIMKNGPQGRRNNL